jgi:hypothetical protein
MQCHGMTLSARRLLAVAALAGAGGFATAQAVPDGAQARAVPTAVAAKTKAKAKANARTNAKAQPKARTKARAVKLAGDVAWAPAGALASERVPLAGTARPGPGGGAPASGGTGTGAGTTGGTPGTGATTTGPLPDAPPQQQALGVTVDERDGYTMLLSRTTLTTGAVVIQLNNAGEDPHNLRIVRTSPAGGGATDFPDTGKQSQTTRTLALAGGTYYLYCTLQQPFSHEAAGMHATLRIDP